MEHQAAERHAVLSWRRFEKMLEDLKAFDGQVRVMSLACFGEPLLNPGIAGMAHVIEAGNYCREIRMTANGSLLTEEKSRALIDAGIDLLQVSIEALSSGGYRKFCGVNIDFEQIVHNVETFYRLSRARMRRLSDKGTGQDLQLDLYEHGDPFQ